MKQTKHNPAATETTHQRRADCTTAVDRTTASPSVKGLNELIAQGRQFSTIYADVPWSYDNKASRGAADNHYPTLTVEQIAALPIRQLATDSAHLHLWTTNAFLFDAKRVIEAWGFIYKSALIWVKPQLGLGNYYRNAHEYMLLGCRGRRRFRRADCKSWIEAPRTRHSRKPPEVRQLIESVSYPPYLELFAREVTAGWYAWGNEVPGYLYKPDESSTDDFGQAHRHSEGLWDAVDLDGCAESS